MMLANVKLAMRIRTTAFDSELLNLIGAGCDDIAQCGARFSFVRRLSDGEVVDYVISDPLVARAVTTYVRLNFGSPDDYDRLKASYDEQKGQLRECSGFGLIDAENPPDPEED